MTSDRRVIEDYIPIEAISAEASREKSVRKGHISTLHLWWARRPLVACRAAVYGALVPFSYWSRQAGARGLNPVDGGRVLARDFVADLCQYPGNAATIADAQRHILAAHAERLSDETGRAVTVQDIEQGRAPRPKVLDMFAGGGTIPLEALRLGCDAHALDLNPVAHIIQLCTLVYPQKYGQPDKSARGSANDGTWAGLAEEVRYWGNWALKRVGTEIRDLYPPIPDPEALRPRQIFDQSQLELGATVLETRGHQRFTTETPAGYLTPVAYLWTRTVRCKNPGCGAAVPLVRQTWLCKKSGRYVALKMIVRPQHKRVRFDVVEAPDERGLGFDPEAFSKAGNATCPFCGTVADISYVKSEGIGRRIGKQMMAVACTRQGSRGKVYLSADAFPDYIPEDSAISDRLSELVAQSGISVPTEPLPPRGTLGFRIQAYGFQTWGDLFTPRQTLSLLTFVKGVREAEAAMRTAGLDADRIAACSTMLAALVDRLADFNSNLCVFNYTGGRGVVHTFGRHALPMVWDFAESNPFNPDGASWVSGLEDLPAGFNDADLPIPGIVQRGSATRLSWPDDAFDAVVTDPPYYDNVPYADISDFFYVWLKRTVGHLYPEHFSTELTPKRSEAVAEPMRFGGDREKAKQAYEAMMLQAFCEARRVLRADGRLAVVYAHKTTLGWATLVDALRQAGLTVAEAWPLDTEKPGRLRAQGSAALASSIFLVARKREGTTTGSYEDNVQPDLEMIVRERVDTLWQMGIAGADLVIAAVGAGLRAFTRYGRVEYANGEEVPAERFLAEVEGVVLDTLLEKIFAVPRSGISAVDGQSRCYVLWRFTYRAAEIDAGEAIVFTYGQPIELDGPRGLSSGSRPLVLKKGKTYRLLDYNERGHDERLGQPSPDAERAPLIDVLHRTLWLMEYEPRKLHEFLTSVRPDRERLRLLAQTLAGRGLSGKAEEESRPLIATTVSEQAALAKLTANWRALVETPLDTLI